MQRALRLLRHGGFAVGIGSWGRVFFGRNRFRAVRRGRPGRAMPQNDDRLAVQSVVDDWILLESRQRVCSFLFSDYNAEDRCVLAQAGITASPALARVVIRPRWYVHRLVLVD